MNEKNDFNIRLIFEHASILEPMIEGNQITVPLENLLVDGDLFASCIIIFFEVTKSTRRFSEYIGNPLVKEEFKGFKPVKVFNDITATSTHTTNEYIVEGVFKTAEGQAGWMSWDLEAESYTIQCDPS